MIIDAHQHFWAVSRGDYGWLENNPAVGAIARDIRPADLRPHLSRHRIDRTVLVQAAPTLEETEYLLGLADATDFIAKVVGWIDFEDKSHARHLARFAKHPKFAGVRPMIQDIADENWMHRPEVQWAFAAIIEHDVTFDALGHPRHLAAFGRLFHRYPHMRTVIDHGMKPSIRTGEFDAWAAGMSELASFPHVTCKLSGLLTEAASGANEATLKPYVAHLLASFGPDRLMWGSDWPVLELAAGYDDWWSMARALVPAAAADAIFGETASRFYRIR